MTGRHEEEAREIAAPGPLAAEVFGVPIPQQAPHVGQCHRSHIIFMTAV